MACESPCGLCRRAPVPRGATCPCPAHRGTYHLHTPPAPPPRYGWSGYPPASSPSPAATPLDCLIKPQLNVNPPTLRERMRETMLKTLRETRRSSSMATCDQLIGSSKPRDQALHMSSTDDRLTWKLVAVLYAQLTHSVFRISDSVYIVFTVNILCILYTHRELRCVGRSRPSRPISTLHVQPRLASRPPKETSLSSPNSPSQRKTPKRGSAAKPEWTMTSKVLKFLPLEPSELPLEV